MLGIASLSQSAASTPPPLQPHRFSLTHHHVFPQPVVAVRPHHLLRTRTVLRATTPYGVPSDSNEYRPAASTNDNDGADRALTSEMHYHHDTAREPGAMTGTQNGAQARRDVVSGNSAQRGRTHEGDPVAHNMARVATNIPR